MRTELLLVLVATAGLSACALDRNPASTVSTTSAGRPRETLPPGFDPVLVRQDLVASASARFGPKALAQVRQQPTYLIVKRFMGMPPPPPAGAGPNWRAPTPMALLARRAEGWMVATASGWRPANQAAIAELDGIISDPAFWAESDYTPPCPDFGASQLLLRAPVRGETVRSSMCTSAASRVVEAALRA